MHTCLPVSRPPLTTGAYGLDVTRENQQKCRSEQPVMPADLGRRICHANRKSLKSSETGAEGTPSPLETARLCIM